MQEQESDLFADAVRQLLQGECTPAHVRAIEAGAAPRALWAALEQSGFADALVPEAQGGPGLELAQLFDVWSLCGSHALPVPLAETMVARALLAHAGMARPEGSIALAQGRLRNDGSLHAMPVHLGAVADSVLVQHGRGWSLLPVARAASGPAAFCLDADLCWPAAEVRSLAPDQFHGADLRTLQACLLAAQLAGALMEVFQRTLQYANERQQFGRPIGKFQAIQHQLAVMSEHVFAARMAARLGCAARAQGLVPDRLRVAVAKARCSQAALAVAEAAHAIHGAMGFTEEYDLQLFTRRLHAWRQAAGSESHWHGVAGEALVHGHQGSTLDAIRSTTDMTA
ncbi:MAG: acyl-CoA dehydrogenase family protein [Burkholderiaceae bacterium]|jgi:acyl-CoA dehydrogenase|nr:acyl-CoA dehydrogenase family protein [Burkholderiaceae bacterium]